MVHRHTFRFAARSYEMDSYRHLNNGVYLGWFEQARLEYLQSLGFSYDGFADREQWIVVARTEVDFRVPLHLGDALLAPGVEGRHAAIDGVVEVVCSATFRGGRSFGRCRAALRPSGGFGCRRGLPGLGSLRGGPGFRRSPSGLARRLGFSGHAHVSRKFSGQTLAPPG